MMGGLTVLVALDQGPADERDDLENETSLCVEN
jgi:hypothetical protein